MPTPLPKNLEKSLGKLNVLRLALAPIGGEIVGSVSTAIDLVADTVVDSMIDGMIEAAVDAIMDELEKRLDKSDEMIDRQTNQAIEVARQNSKEAFNRTMAKKVFFLTQNALFLRRQYSIHHNRLGDLEIDGAGVSWFD
ncbi:hypothetical protein THRCLA_05367 [Thraustotheca clavata]|uniref:Uncharacterized protein n=1 Tax=Thraustotheca clavata TaxID=74557 RepID=A0A1V9ZW53_9STRA|nr:hypothetical protein THRCLA_05367 [Thraustotheca clavata]